jgi:cytochrome P450
MRAIVNRGFSPRRIAAWEPRVRALVAERLDALGRGESFDLMRDLAIPLPVSVIAEMLGVEPERHADFKGWSDAVIHFSTGSGRADRYSDAFVDAMTGLIRYLRGVARERRQRPADDLISTLVTSQEGEVGLSDYEVVLFVTLLLVAGNETTTNLIGNAVNALLDHPEQLERVVDDPSLVPALIEETLRYDSPVQLVFRNTTRETEIAGTRIPEGAWVVPILGSANRDERRFEDPDRFDVGRNPQGHFGFGFGRHFCLGASLARLEARATLEALVPLLADFRKCQTVPERIDSFLVRGPSRLELKPAA